MQFAPAGCARFPHGKAVPPAFRRATAWRATAHPQHGSHRSNSKNNQNITSADANNNGGGSHGKAFLPRSSGAGGKSVMSSSSSSSSSGGEPDATSTFQPHLLRAKLQHAKNVDALQSIWQQHQQQFNSFHFSVLMQQLTKLHVQVSSGMAQARAAQQQQTRKVQQDQRRADLAELEQELGPLLHGSDDPSAPSTPKSSSSSSGKPHSRGLADLCPALDGYEHVIGTAAAPARPPRQKQQRKPRSQQLQRNEQMPSTAAAAGGPALPGPGMGKQQVPTASNRPAWQPKANSRLQQQQMQHQRQQQHQLAAVHKLALAAAGAALQPDRRQGLDDRALVMVAYNMAKMQIFDRHTLGQLLQVLRAGALPRLDAQQLTNLVWAVGVCGSSGQADRSPYMPLAPMVQRASAAAVAATGSSSSSCGSRSDSAAGVQQCEERNLGPDAQADVLPQPFTAAAAGAQRAHISWSASASSSSTAGSTVAPPSDWLESAAACLLQLLPVCSSSGVSMALWGFAQLGFSPEPDWWQQLWSSTHSKLGDYSPQDLALLMCAIGKLGPKVPSPWLSTYCSAACDCMPAMSSQQLTMCLWGLACAEAQPHKAFVLLWFLTSMGMLQQAATQELSMWLYSLALLRITPSPTWCSAFVEASFTRLTAPSTRPQDLVTAMWAISRLSWSPPLLYWRGLMEAARSNLGSFGPQDLANTLLAAASVDISCVSDAWLSCFIKASQPRLMDFEPVQLAHTAKALATITTSGQDAGLHVIHAAWQAAFIRAAAQQLAASRFSARNLSVLLTSLAVLRFKPEGVVQQFVADAQVVLKQLEAQNQQQSSG